MNGLEGLSQLPTAALIGLGALIVVQLVLDVIAFVDLYKRPVGQVALGNKWIWVAIILLVNTIGAILYLAIGRKAAAVSEVPSAAPVGTRTENAADLLYGHAKDTDGR